MPKQEPAAEQKPIYVPRNIYVPVIRPVFVPRERIIVRPQIIHVARPVLVDRPVPIQQRPLVIERDRPVPVRVETVERTEPCGEYQEESDCKPQPGVTETTYHEFSQGNFQQHTESNADFQQENSSNYNFGGTEEVDKNKQLVLDLLEEAERRKNSLESKSNDSFANKFNSESSKILDSMPYNSGYTLEVLDQRVSDKFEKVDQETIKQRYGVDSFQYLPTDTHRSGSSATNDFYQASNEASNLRSNGGSYKSLASANETVSNAYGNFASTSGLAESSASLYGQNYGSNGNISTILNDLAKMTNK